MTKGKVDIKKKKCGKQSVVCNEHSDFQDFKIKEREMPAPVFQLVQEDFLEMNTSYSETTARRHRASEQ